MSVDGVRAYVRNVRAQAKEPEPQSSGYEISVSYNRHTGETIVESEADYQWFQFFKNLF